MCYSGVERVRRSAAADASVAGGPAVARNVLVILVMGFAAVLTSCSSGGDGAASPTTASASSNPSVSVTSTTTPDPVSAAVLAGWRGYWAAYDEAASRADPDWPALAQNMTGSALRDVQVYLVGLRAEGLVERGGLELRPKVVSVTASTAVVNDCLTDDGHQYDKAGNLRGQPGPVTRGVEAKLLLEGGKWKVSERPVSKVGVCPA